MSTEARHARVYGRGKRLLPRLSCLWILTLHLLKRILQRKSEAWIAVLIHVTPRGVPFSSFGKRVVVYFQNWGKVMSRHQKTTDTERTVFKIDEINLHRFTPEKAQVEIWAPLPLPSVGSGYLLYLPGETLK